MTWTGRFQKDNTRPSNSTIGIAHADWYEADVLICTYSQRVDGVGDKIAFKANAIAYKDKFIADATKNDNISSALTTFLNN